MTQNEIEAEFQHLATRSDCCASYAFHGTSMGQPFTLTHHPACRHYMQAREIAARLRARALLAEYDQMLVTTRVNVDFIRLALRGPLPTV